jgi:hypothetical protein
MAAVMIDVDTFVDQVAARLKPAELPKDFGEALRRDYPSGYTIISTIGYGPYPVYLDTRINPDGSIRIDLCGPRNRVVWSHVVRPAE